MGSRWFSALFLGVVILVLGGLLSLGYFVSSIVEPASEDRSLVSFSIEKGEGVHEISARLYDAGLIRSKWNFEAYVWLRRWGSSLKAGEYTFARNVSAQDLAEVLALGKNASGERTVVFIEGWTNADIGNYLERVGVVNAKDFNQALSDIVKRPTSISALADKPTQASLEGYVFPDTYRIYRGSTAEEIAQKALQNFENRLSPELRNEISERGLSIFEVLTMASILEKEVRHPEDMALVADIFYRRMKAGMRLESDATLNYILQKKDPTLNAEDLTNTSPYNTYKYYGLPPGPISNPGLNAIRAAVFPKPNTYFFFLTSKDGETVYATTFAEHKKNKELYLR